MYALSMTGYWTNFEYNRDDNDCLLDGGFRIKVLFYV